MNTEILKDILDLTEDKQNTIVYFLNPEIMEYLNRTLTLDLAAKLTK